MSEPDLPPPAYDQPHTTEEAQAILVEKRCELVEAVTPTRSLYRTARGSDVLIDDMGAQLVQRYRVRVWRSGCGCARRQ